MSENLQCCLRPLALLAKSKPNTRKTLLNEIIKNKKIFNRYYDALKEICINIEQKNLKLTKYKKTKLKKHQKLIDLFCKNLKNKNLKKKLFFQSGGALPFIIPTVVSAFSTYLFDKVLNK